MYMYQGTLHAVLPLISLGGLNKVVSLQFPSITGSVLALSKAWPRAQLASNIHVCHYTLQKIYIMLALWTKIILADFIIIWQF